MHRRGGLVVWGKGSCVAGLRRLLPREGSSRGEVQIGCVGRFHQSSLSNELAMYVEKINPFATSRGMAPQGW